MLSFIRPPGFQAKPFPLTPDCRLILVSSDSRLLPPRDWLRLSNIPAETIQSWSTPPISLGRLGATSYAVAQGHSPLPNSFTLRELAQQPGNQDAAALAGYALQILDFHSTHRFCGRCGTPTQTLEHETARQCPSCGLTVYPRVAPAVMVLIWRGQDQQREFLLARGPRHTPGLFSVVAGFTEPSETLEDCCRREVLEELGVTIHAPRYVMSQPWPLPHSLMVAFTAEYAGGEITPQAGKIEEARWFSAQQLPLIPAPYSCAYHLIQHGVTANLSE